MFLTCELKNNNYYCEKPPKKFGGFIFCRYICSVNKTSEL